MYDGYNEKVLTFQHTAARRRLDDDDVILDDDDEVSTHSRLKAAGLLITRFATEIVVSTHSRLKAAGYLHTLRCLETGFQHTAA